MQENQHVTDLSEHPLTLQLNEQKSKIKPRWNNQYNVYKEGLKYIKGRQTGVITSLKTPWKTVNNATINGFEWGSMTVIGGRPGTGKTAIVDQIIISSYDLHPENNHRTLQFQLEMPAKAQAVRALSSKVKLTYKELCSADKKLDEDKFKQCVAYAQAAVKYDIEIVDKTPTVEEFKAIIDDYMTKYSFVVMETQKEKQPDGTTIEKKVAVVKYMNTLISLDHSLLIKRKKGQSQQDMLFDLGEACTYLKRKYPIAFLILSQLNRNVDKPERNEDGKYGNYVLTSDIFGSDALLQHAETVIGLNAPAKQKIRYYGPEKYVIDDINTLVMHFIKSRNGDLGLTFFKANFQHMEILEMAAPAQMEQIKTRS